MAIKFCCNRANFLLIFFASFKSEFSSLSNSDKFFDTLIANVLPRGALLLAVFLDALSTFSSSIAKYTNENLYYIMKILLNVRVLVSILMLKMP